MSTRDDRTVPPPISAPGLRYRRILLKMSGEALCAQEGGFGHDPAAIGLLSEELAQAYRTLGAQLALVVGGGNIFRGLRGASSGMDRATADYMGMLATVMNALALQDALEKRGVPTRVQTALEMPHLEKGRVVIFAAGTGNPYFSTDTAAALRAMEIHADVFLKATKVDGVYERDPKKYADAKMFAKLSYDSFIERRIGVMDTTAVTLCRDNKLPIRVFRLADRGNIARVILGEEVGTTIDEKG